MRPHTHRSSVRPHRTVRLVAVALLLVLTIAPLYWVVITSLKSPREVILPVPTLIPQRITMENYRAVLTSGFVRNVLNSVVVAGLSTSVSIVVAFAAAYALVRYRFPLRFNTVFLVWVLLVKILPPMVLSVPLYEIFSLAGLLNSHVGLALVYQVYTLPYALWILIGFLRSVPPEIEEAAAIDGAGPLATLSKVVAPLSAGGIAATSIFSAIMAWDEFLFALLFIRRPRMLTLPLRIANYITEYETEWGELMAAGILASIPLLLLTSFVYKRLSHGFATSLK
ncbi:MAG: carbohydrate ABC transporter permease [Spirochaetales bacterium]|nr:carbohydrate ABC transporter permease [Spirochaetales bacterium]